MSTRSVAVGALRQVAALKDRVRPPKPGTAVLLYYRVGARTPMSADLPRARFADQMAKIAERALTLDDALTGLEGPTPRPGSVVVTFDDGTADVLEVALPVCVEHEVPMLLYLATRFVEEQVDFPSEGRPTSWQALADGLTTGYLQVGSHTHSHALLDRIDPASAEEELDRSIGLLQDRLGVEPAHFAYPKALAPSAANEAAVRRRFRSAALAGTRLNHPGATDRWRLARTPIQGRDDARWFDAKVACGLGLEDDVRRLANRYRYRGYES